MTRKLFSLMATVLLLTGCGDNNEKQTETDHSSDAVTTLKTVALRETREIMLHDSLKWRPGNYYADFDICMVMPQTVDGKEATVLSDSIVKKAFGKNAKADISKTLSSLVETPLGFEDVKGLKTKKCNAQVVDDGTHAVSFLKVEAFPSYQNQKIITYTIFNSSFLAGAAHGYEASQYINYDIAGAKVLTPALLFTNIEEVKKTVWNEMLRNENVSPMLLVNEVPHIDNFYVNDYSMTFVYNPYEVAAYAAGPVSVTVGAYELKAYLTPYAKQFWK